MPDFNCYQNPYREGIGNVWRSVGILGTHVGEGDYAARFCGGLSFIARMACRKMRECASVLNARVAFSRLREPSRRVLDWASRILLWRRQYMPLLMRRDQSWFPAEIQAVTTDASGRGLWNNS